MRSRGADQDEALRNLKRAWQRALCDERGRLHADGRLIMRNLMRHANFFGLDQALAGRPEERLVIATRRQMVTHILACIGLGEDEIASRPESALELAEIYQDG